MNNYILNEEIGKGSTRTVYKGRFRRTTDFYAIMSIDKSRKDRVINSVQILRSLQHPNIIEFHNWYETTNHLWVITEYCTGGDLETILHSKIDLKPAAIKAFGRDIALGLSFMHSKGVLCNDLKCGSLLMDSTATLRFHDFGLSCKFADAGSAPVIGSPQYMAPELFVGEKPLHSMASDMWAFGCVLYAMATGSPPFVADDLEQLLTLITTQPAPRSSRIDLPLQSLLDGLLDKDPLRRFSWPQVMKSDFWEEPMSAPVTLFPRQPAFEEFKMQQGRSGRGGGWCDEEVQTGIARAVAAAMANHPQNSTAGGGRSGETLDLKKEIDFRSTAAVSLLGAATSASSERGNRSFDTNPSGNGSIVAAAARRSRPLDGSSATGGAGAVGNGPRRRGSNGRSSTGVRAVTGGAAAYTSGKEIFTANAANAAEEKVLTSKLVVFAGGAMKQSKLGSLLPHPTDDHIRPLSNNSRIEAISKPLFNADALGFTPLSNSEVIALSSSGLTDYIRAIYRKMSDSSAPLDAVTNVMNYVASISGNHSMANVLVNSSMRSLFTKLAGRQDAKPAFRAMAAYIVGLLVRWATFIRSEVARSGILPNTIALFEEEKSVLVRRKLLASIGELLFYIAIQDEKERAQWSVNDANVQRIFLAALDTDDDILRHYAAKTIENMASAVDRKMTRDIFASAAVVKSLMTIYALPQGDASREYLRSTAYCAAVKLTLINEQLILPMMQSPSVPISSYTESVISSRAPRTTIVLLTFLNNALVKGLVAVGSPFATVWSQSQGKADTSPELFTSALRSADAEEIIGNVLFVCEDVLEFLSDSLEQSSAAIHGKALLFVMLVGCVGGNAITRLLTARNVNLLGRMMRDASDYVKSCGTALGVFLGWFISDRLGSVARRVSSTTTPAYLSAIQELLRATELREAMKVQSDAIESLALCVSKALTSNLYGSYEEGFNTLADRIAQNVDLVLEHQDAICMTLVNSYTEMLRLRDTNRRFAAIRFLVSVMVPIGGERESAKTPSSSNQAIKAATQVLNAMMPLLTPLLQETSPIPTNALRLAVVTGEIAHRALAPLVDAKMLDSVMDYLSSSGSNTDLYYPLTFLQLCLTVSQKDGLLAAVMRRNLFKLALATLESAKEKNVDQLVEASCALVSLLLRQASPDTRLFSQCSSNVSAHAVEQVLLPLCSKTASTIVEESASSALCELSHSTMAVQDVLRSSLGVSLFQSALAAALEPRTNVKVASNLTRAMRQACEGKRRTELRSVGANRNLLNTLKRVSTLPEMRLASSDAGALLKQLQD